MSIGFNLITKSKSISVFQKLLNVVAPRHNATISHEEDSSTITICRLGSIFFHYEAAGNGVAIKGECQSNLLGAGFHKTAIELIDEVVDLNPYPFCVKDDTEYYDHRDFSRMRTEHFYHWLSKIMELCNERADEDYKMSAVCWDVGKYMPCEVQGTVVTPFGFIHPEHFIARRDSEGIEALATDFYMWNNEERNALFYRNSALSALWEDCYFMPSARSDEDNEINAFIIENLEKAASMDSSLPFPKEDYLLVCHLAEKAPIDLSELPDYVSDYPIGYRKGKVTYRIGNVSFSLPGNLLYFEEEENSKGYCDDAEQSWHIVRTLAYSIQDGEINYLEDDENVLSKERFFENGKCRLYDLGGSEDESDEYVYQCQVITDCQFTLFTISCGGKEEATAFCNDFTDTLTATKEEQAAALNPEDENAEELIRTSNTEETNHPPKLYEEEELDALEEHIDTYFGESDNVFHEIASPDIHVDIFIIEPTQERNYYTLATMGMGAHRMNVPDELKEYKLERAEIVLYLPADWNVNGSEEKDYWPFRWLKILARLPIETNTWLGWGHTVPNIEPFANNTQLSGVMLINPEVEYEGASVCQLPNGDEVNFYQMIPLYEEEMIFKIENDAEALLERMDDVSAVIDIHRKNVCGN